MKNRNLVLVVLSGVALLAAGCGQQQVSKRPYQTMADMTLADREADFVAEGTIESTDEVEHYPAGEVFSNVFGKLGQDCVTKVRVTFNVARAVKGPRDFKNPIAFWYYAPCWHGEPNVLLGFSLPPVLVVGHRLRVYLDDRDGQYWLIAHERAYAAP